MATQLHDQTNLLPPAQLIIVFASQAATLLVSFIDQNSLGVALPTIGKELHCANTILWAGTSALIANTVFQVVYGRLSDIFGRKAIFLGSVGFLAVGDLLGSFAQTGPQLYAFRAIAGIGNGGITALSMVILSDVVTLENRGKYQGILGSFVGLGNTIGPFVAAGFSQNVTWRAMFWMLSPLSVITGIISFFILPNNMPKRNLVQQIKMIDFNGLMFSSVAIILLLIPISGGGSYFSWQSPMVISMLVLGSAAAVMFGLAEWRTHKPPMMPLPLFKNPAVSAIMLQNFLFGIVYYGFLYYMPIYFQNARQWDPLKSASMAIPAVLGQAVASVLSGQYISRRKHYGEVIWCGYVCWTLGAGLRLLFGRSTPQYAIVLVLLVEGWGIGNVFQPTLIAVQAHSPKADRAVVISVRNFLRQLGGAVGLAIAAALFTAVFERHIPTDLPAPIATQLHASVFSAPSLTGLTASQHDAVLDAYMAASHAVFMLWVPLMGVCLVSNWWVKDRGLKRPDEKDEEEVLELGEVGREEEGRGVLGVGVGDEKRLAGRVDPAGVVEERDQSGRTEDV